MKEFKTTTDLLDEAIRLRASAEHVTTRESHAAWWDEKVTVLRRIDDALESGAFDLDAYQELTGAKNILWTAERAAGKAAHEYKKTRIEY